MLFLFSQSNPHHVTLYHFYPYRETYAQTFLSDRNLNKISHKIHQNFVLHEQSTFLQILYILNISKARLKVKQKNWSMCFISLQNLQELPFTLECKTIGQQWTKINSSIYIFRNMFSIELSNKSSDFYYSFKYYFYKQA